MSQHTRPHRVRIFGMNNDADDVPCIFQADVAPGATAVIAAPGTTKAFAHVTANSILPFANVNNIFVTGRYGYRTDGAAKVFVGDVSPVAAPVCGFPHPAASGAKVKGVLGLVTAGYRCTPSAAERPHEAVFYFGKQQGVGVFHFISGFSFAAF